MNRATSVYRIHAPAVPVDALIVRAHGLDIAGSGTYSGVGYIALRLPGGDTTARKVATQITQGAEHTIYTGYGAHKRQIEDA